MDLTENSATWVETYRNLDRCRDFQSKKVKIVPFKSKYKVLAF